MDNNVIITTGGISKWLDLEQGSKMDDGVGASKRIGG